MLPLAYRGPLHSRVRGLGVGQLLQLLQEVQAQLAREGYKLTWWVSMPRVEP